MALKLRRGTDADRLTITPEEGELIYTTDNKELFVGDGTTAGGHLISGGGISNLIEDTTPQLGGNLDTNNFNISGTGTIAASHLYGVGTTGNITIESVDGTIVSGNVNIQGVNTAKTNQEGGDINIIGGNGNSNGTGGDIVITGGAGSSGGIISIVSGNGTINHSGDIIVDTGTGVTVNGIISIGPTNAAEIQIGNGSNLLHLNADVEISGDIIPDTDSTYDLGSGLFRFKDLYLSGSSLHLGDAVITSSGYAINLPSGSTINGVSIPTSSSTTTPGGPLQAELVTNGYSITGVGNIIIGGYVSAQELYGNLIGTDSTVIVNFQNNQINADINRTDDLTITSSGTIAFSTSEVIFPFGATITNLDINQLSDSSNLLTGSSANVSISAETTTGGAILRLTVDSTTDDITIVEGSSMSITMTDANTITVGLSGTLDTSDSSDFEFIPGVVMRSNLSVENNLDVIGTVTANAFISTQTGTPEVYSETNIDLTAGNRVSVTTSPFRLAQLTTTERNLITAQNGDLIYNTTANRFQGYQNGSWINIDDGTAA